MSCLSHVPPEEEEDEEQQQLTTTLSIVDRDGSWWKMEWRQEKEQWIFDDLFAAFEKTYRGNASREGEDKQTD